MLKGYESIHKILEKYDEKFKYYESIMDEYYDILDGRDKHITSLKREINDIKELREKHRREVQIDFDRQFRKITEKDLLIDELKNELESVKNELSSIKNEDYYKSKIKKEPDNYIEDPGFKL